MKIKRIDTILEKGSGTINEDSLHAGDDIFGVFDGATSLDKAKFENHLTGGCIASSTACRIFSKNGYSLEQLARNANCAIREAMLSHGVKWHQRDKLWSTSAAVARIKKVFENENFFHGGPALLEWIQTGDSFILLIFKDQSYKVLGKTDDHDYETLSMWKKMAAIEKNTLTNPSLKISEALGEQIKRVRMGMNRSYGVLNGEDAAEDFLQSGVESLEGVTDILVFTDGLTVPSPMPKKIKNFDILVQEYLKRGLTGLKNRIREMESLDKECRLYPRFKCHDDIAAIAVVMESETVPAKLS